MAIRRAASLITKGHTDIKLTTRYLSTLSLALIAHVLLSIVMLMALACTVQSNANIDATVEARLVQEPAIEPTEDALESFNRVYRACLMSSSKDDKGESAIPPSVALQELGPEDQMVFRRVFDFSGLSPVGKRAAMSKFCRFKGMEPIINFFPNQDVETAFRSVIEREPTRDMLDEELDRILSARQADPFGSAGSRFAEVFTTPQQAVSAAIQPYLAGLNLRLRDGIWTILMERLMTNLAANPEQHQSQDAIFDLLGTTRGEVNSSN